MLRFENITLFVAITHYYLFNQSLSDFAQVDVANHLKSWNEHSMSYDGVPQDWFKPWNPWEHKLLKNERPQGKEPQHSSQPADSSPTKSYVSVLLVLHTAKTTAANECVNLKPRVQ